MKIASWKYRPIDIRNFIVIFFLCSYIFSCAASSVCSKYDSNMGALFDLSDLVRSPGQPSYSVIDGDLPCTVKVEQNFTYVFNICGTIVDGMPPPCLQMDGLNQAGAVQIDTRATLDDPSDDWCFLVGSYSESTTKMNLINPDDPTAGLQLTYFGDYCHTPRAQRRFQINLECADKLTVVPTHALETSHCTYEVTMPSIYGCPLECPISSRRLCAGNGHCAYDNDKNGARCFCNKGFKGPDCSTPDMHEEPPLNYSPALLGLIITLFVIIALLVGGIFVMFKQLSAYREDISHYQVLKGGDDDHRTHV